MKQTQQQKDMSEVITQIRRLLAPQAVAWEGDIRWLITAYCDKQIKEALNKQG